MNWIGTLLFFTYIIIQYSLVGEFIINFAHFNKNTPTRLLLGFLGTFFLMFLIAFPCQLLHTSWNVYFSLMIIALVAINIFLINKYKKDINIFFTQYEFSRIKKQVAQFIVNNWVCILFVLLFTVFSMANELPIYELNYDDFYYIGKIVNNIGADVLLNEDYYNGQVLIDSGVDLVRIINTYELSYGFFAYLFHIDVTFFCRVTMIVHTYSLFSLVYKELASLIIPRKYSQFALVPFFYFLIPHGYIQSGVPYGFMRVCSYDLWQFQTAAFYGGSVVRMISIPTLILFSFQLIQKMDFKKVLVMAMISITFISFSTIFIQIFILFCLLILIVKFTYMFIQSISQKNLKGVIIYSFLLMMMIFFLLFTKVLDNFTFINTEDFRNCINGFNAYIDAWYNYDVILRIGIIPLLIGLIITKGIHNKMIYLVVFLFYALFRTMFFPELYALSSFNVFFVINRTIAAVQYLVLLMITICILQLYLLVFKNRYIPNIISSLFIGFIILFFGTHMDRFKQFDYLGSGISKSGWDFSRILDVNTTMSLDIFDDVGDYFDNLPYGNYLLYAPDSFKYNDKITYSLGFLTASNRIQIHERGGIPEMTQDEINIMNSYCLGDSSETKKIEYIVEKYKISYILVFDKNNTEELLDQGYELVLEARDHNNSYNLMYSNN